MGPYRITGLKTLYKGWSTLMKLSVTSPSGAAFEREVEDHGAAVAVLPYDPERRQVMLVRQMRAPVLHVSGVPSLLEAPAGMLDDEEPETCARREAEEEVGLHLHAVEPVGEVWTCPGLSTERIHLFLAAYGSEDRVSEGGGLSDEHEDIEVVEMPLEEIWRYLENGGVSDLKTMALLQALRLRHPALWRE
jgi:nudix-type nucleoside diphosphatase (YffH/AdpP family)